MAHKELLVHLNQAEGVDSRLRLTIDLASRHGSHLTALFVDEWNQVQMSTRATAEMGLVEAEALETLDRAVATAIDRTASQLRNTLEEVCGKRGVEATWHQVRGFCEAVIQRSLPYADLCILGHEGLSADVSSDSGLCESLLVGAAAPILFVPKSTTAATLASRIVVAWDSSRAAMRALNDAIPLIDRADQTLVLNVGFGKSSPSTATLRLLTERLRRHCASVDFVQLQRADRSIAEILRSRAQEFGADLIVCGAFGHSRFKENLFGGVTRELLDQTKLPLLLSH